MNLTFLAHDSEGNMQLINRTTAAVAPDVDQEWELALAMWKEKVPLLGDLTFVGALVAAPGRGVRWYPDLEDEPTADVIGRVLH